MNNYAKIKEDLSKLLQSCDLTKQNEVEEIIGNLKLISEAEKASLDTEKTKLEVENFKKLQNKESNKFLISTIAPLVTALALIITLAFQFVQYNENNKQQIESDEDAQWRSLLGKVDLLGTGIASNNQEISVPILLKSFLASKRYGKQCRELTSEILSRVAKEKVFQIIFPEFMSKTNWTNFSDVTYLLKGLGDEYNLDTADITSDSNQMLMSIQQYNAGYTQNYIHQFGTPPDSIPTPLSSVQFSKKLSQDEHYAQERLKEITMVGRAIGDFLRKNERPDSIKLDLSSCFFNNCDLSNIDLTNSDWSNMTLTKCKLDNSILHNINGWQESLWTQCSTAWWRVKSIDKDFMISMRAGFPYSPECAYYEYSANDSLLFSQYLKQ
jgi:hypothetical protein